MWNPLKQSIHKTQDMVWLHQMYFEKPNTMDEKLELVVYLDDFAPEPFDVRDAYIMDEDANPEEKEGETDDDLDEQDDTKDTNPEEKEGMKEMVSSESELETDGCGAGQGGPKSLKTYHFKSFYQYFTLTNFVL